MRPQFFRQFFSAQSRVHAHAKFVTLIASMPNPTKFGTFSRHRKSDSIHHRVISPPPPTFLVMHIKMHTTKTTEHTNALQIQNKFVSARIYLPQMQTPRGGMIGERRKKKKKKRRARGVVRNRHGLPDTKPRPDRRQRSNRAQARVGGAGEDRDVAGPFYFEEVPDRDATHLSPRARAHTPHSTCSRCFRPRKRVLLVVAGHM